MPTVEGKESIPFAVAVKALFEFAVVLPSITFDGEFQSFDGDVEPEPPSRDRPREFFLGFGITGRNEVEQSVLNSVILFVTSSLFLCSMNDIIIAIL